MLHTTIRHGLFVERFLVAFASGLFLSLPLYFRELGRDEVFFAQVYALGALGTLTAVAGGVVWLRRWGLARVAPWGCGLFGLGSLVYAVAALLQGPTALYCLASLFQGTGWGVVFTFGPICLSSVVGEADRTRVFTEYAACSTLGVGLGPVAAAKAHTLGVDPVWVFATGVLFSAAGWWVSLRVSRGNRAYAEVRPNTQASGWSEFKTILLQPSSAFLWMVLLGGCVYTAMINLQTTYAQSVGQAHANFYLAYSLAVVGARFGLGRSLSRVPAQLACLGLIGLMACALVLLKWSQVSAVFYIGAALALGVAYGLLYPLIQSQCTAHTTPTLRAATLVYFSLAYFIAVYLFPYLAARAAVAHGYGAVINLLLCIVGLQGLVAWGFYRSQRATTVIRTCS